MALVQIFEFRELAAQLTKEETKSFFIKLFEFDPKLMIHALSSHFIYQSKNRDDTAVNAHCNKLISTIIRSRETDIHREEENNRFDSLPRRIIGVCASYLDQMSYAALSATNRASYLGCNGPNMLNEVNYRCEFRNLYPVLSAFPFATKLCLDCLPCILSIDKMRIIASQISKMFRLYSLDLSKSCRKLIKMIAKNHVTNERITSVVFSLQGNCLDFEGVIRKCQGFIELISRFKHIQFLKVWIQGFIDPEDEDGWKTEALIESLSNLKGLDFDDGGCGIEWSILQLIGHRLEYLALHDREEHFYRSAEQKRIDFVNLRQLRQGDYCMSDCGRIIMKTAIHLEKVRLCNYSDLLKDILTQCAELKYMEIDAFDGVGRGGLDDVLQTLQRSLFSNKTIQRDAFKIRINTSLTAIAECKEYIVKLNRIVKLLAANIVDQWMVIIHIKVSTHNGKEKNQQLIHDLPGRLTSDISKTRVFQSKKHITGVIANPQCTFCGWRESWLMSI